MISEFVQKYAPGRSATADRKCLRATVTPKKGVSMRKRKASLHISLVLIGAAGVGACGRSEEPSMRRDIYGSIGDCQIDWGPSVSCEPFQMPSLPDGAPMTLYYGPWYEGAPHTHSASSSYVSSGHTASAQAPRAIGSQSMNRGGFGGTSAFHSAGG